MIDQIAFAYYGTHLRTAEAIYEANQNLSLAADRAARRHSHHPAEIRAADAARTGSAVGLMGRLERPFS